MKSQSLNALLPGSSVGVIGGGQLGRYFVLAARRMGFDTWVLDPDANAPAMQVAAHTIVAAYDDEAGLEKLAQQCQAVTIEFENVPAKALQQVAAVTRVAPAPAIVQIAQDRHLEKTTAKQFGLEPVAYAVIESADQIEQALETVQLPGILKTSRLGYDGKGQQTCYTVDDLKQAFDGLNGVTCVLEQRIDLATEVSVVLARGADGHSVCFPVAENKHTAGILDISSVPASVSEALQAQAQQLAVRLADGLNYEGVLAVEFFVDREGKLLFNEMAPRPHNSGHYTLDATRVCQFEQQLRALCQLPLGSAELMTPVTMLNVLGDSWEDENSPDWPMVLNEPGAALHLYGKSEARPGRKMGHINCLSNTVEASQQTASKLRAKLKFALVLS